MKIKKMILAGLFAAISAVAAQISIPLPVSPVPITLQVFVVCLAGGILGGKWGGISQLVYVLLGAFGVPVFAQARGGLNIILGPTGGYIIGFVLAAYTVGMIVEKGKAGYLRTLGAMVCGLIIIYLLGTLQLALHLNLTVQKAFLFGIGWFLPMDLLKILLAAKISVSVRQALIRAGLLLQV